MQAAGNIFKNYKRSSPREITQIFATKKNDIVNFPELHRATKGTLVGICYSLDLLTILVVYAAQVYCVTVRQ